jgi:uncharacterized protein
LLDRDVEAVRILIWVDLANSPHVSLFAPIVRDLRRRGHEVLITARDHAETVELALQHWKDVVVVGGESPTQRVAKAYALAGRAHELTRLMRIESPDVALSHGSYAQALAATRLRVPLVTMMDYEHQPANHLSFRLARRVIVPKFFPNPKLRTYGANDRKVIRYNGFKEELYLAGFRPDPGIIEKLGLDPGRVIAVFRQPPRGALYHRIENQQFEDVVAAATGDHRVQAVLLPRGPEARTVLRGRSDLFVPPRPIDALSLIAEADLTIGGGGTMTRESALLGTPTYTVFVGQLAAADAALVRLGLLHDLRGAGLPAFVKRASSQRVVAETGRDEILRAIDQALTEVP